MLMARTNVGCALALSALALAGCAAEPPLAPPSAPPAPAADEAAARSAVGVALASLSKSTFDVGACNVADARVAPEAEVQKGAPVGERCTMLVARRADRSWIVGVRPATTSAPSRAGGALALVTLTPGAEGVSHIDYVH
jgi:hypothetical protein